MAKHLNNNELTLIDREGERIKELLSNTVNSFPDQATTISGMAKWLDSSRTTCQRVIEAINTNSGTDTIIALPGPSGLKKFFSLIEQKKLATPISQNNKDIIVIFESLIRKYSSSHSALKKRLKESKTSGSCQNFDETQARKKLFEASSSFLNECIDVNFTLFLHKENDDESQYLKQYVLSSYQGCRFGENSRPLVVLVNPDIEKPHIDKTNIVSIEDDPANTPMLSFIKEFTSENILKSAESTPHSSGRLVMPNYLDESVTSNVALLKRYDQDLISPSFGGKYAGLTGVEIRNPTRKLIKLCFLKKTLALKSLVNEKVLSVSPGFQPPTDDSLWFDRLYTEADITILQPHVNYQKKLALDGANEIVQAFFALTDNNPDDYLGYLMQVDYPIWSSAYMMQFPVTLDI